MIRLCIKSWINDNIINNLSIYGGKISLRLSPRGDATLGYPKSLKALIVLGDLR